MNEDTQDIYSNLLGELQWLIHNGKTSKHELIEYLSQDLQD